ncbi:MAG TPA: hypothetical protein VK832_14040 [Burkholderiaceae bacterium]|nr:hypothetical protein [Burkholderiaceae bacterium]
MLLLAAFVAVAPAVVVVPLAVVVVAEVTAVDVLELPLPLPPQEVRRNAINTSDKFRFIRTPSKFFFYSQSG